MARLWPAIYLLLLTFFSVNTFTRFGAPQATCDPTQHNTKPKKSSTQNLFPSPASNHQTWTKWLSRQTISKSALPSSLLSHHSTRNMKGQNPESPPAAASASASAAASLVPNSSSKSTAASAVHDAYSTLITPTKAVFEGQQQIKKDKKRQLQLTVEKGDGAAGPYGKIVLKNKHKKKRSAAAEPEVTTKAPSSSAIKWPPVSSTKSLPPLLGRVEDLLKAEQSSKPSSASSKATSRDTIEFEVNQECE